MQQTFDLYMTEERWKLLEQAQTITGQSQASTIETALREFVEKDAE